MKSLLLKLLYFTVCLSAIGCGVRGDPEAPLEPAEIGRGQPVFQKATEELNIKPVPNPDDIDWEDDPPPNPSRSK